MRTMIYWRGEEKLVLRLHRLVVFRVFCGRLIEERKEMRSVWLGFKFVCNCKLTLLI
jgi:hypothetical protein